MGHGANREGDEVPPGSETGWERCLGQSVLSEAAGEVGGARSGGRCGGFEWCVAMLMTKPGLSPNISSQLMDLPLIQSMAKKPRGGGTPLGPKRGQKGGKGDSRYLGRVSPWQGLP